jgi:hypothetical protein
MLGKAQRTADFKHLLWRRHPDKSWWEGCRPEILATDGRVVRRLSSQHQHIALQVFADYDSARDIATKVEASVAQGVALMGYSMFSEHQAVAILHTADGLQPGWVAFPHKRTTTSTVPTLPLRVADMPKLRVVGGVEIKWASGEMYLDAALEQRGERFSVSPFALNIIDHISGWEVWGQVGRDNETKKLRLTRKDAEIDIRRVNDLRLAARFPVDSVIWREFENDPTLKIWFVVSFDRELLCLPDDWLKFWMRVEL